MNKTFWAKLWYLLNEMDIDFNLKKRILTEYLALWNNRFWKKKEWIWNENIEC